MRSVRSTSLVLLAGLALGCRREPAAEPPSEKPIRWSTPPPSSLLPVLHADPLTIESDAAGFRATGAGPAIAWREPFGKLGRAVEAQTIVSRGFATRLAWTARRDASPDRVSAESYLEVFRGSPIISMFRRVWIEDFSEPIAQELVLSGSFDTLYGFEGRALVERSVGPVELGTADTLKPVVIIYDSPRAAGVILFFPHAGEIRRWFSEDYLVQQRSSVRVTPVSSGDQTSLVISWPELVAPEPEAGGWTSFDGPIFMLPFSGAPGEALKELRFGQVELEPADVPGFPEDGLWPARAPGFEAGGSGSMLSSLRLLRYFPTEFASWMDSTFDQRGHAGGLGWGNTTSAMQGLHLDPLSSRALERDLAFRIAVFFLEAGTEKGAPPNLLTKSEYSDRLSYPEEIRTIVFSQYWEHRMDEFQKLLGSPHVEPAEAERIYSELQRARAVFDVDGKYSWCETLPRGGLWFNYFDLPLIPHGSYVVNAHLTTLIVIGELVTLARGFGRPEDEEHWRQLFALGVAGLLEVLADDAMWLPAPDQDELRYQKNGARHCDYHIWTLGRWLPLIIERSADLAPNQIPALLTLVRRLARAPFLDNYPDVRQDALELADRWDGT